MICHIILGNHLSKVLPNIVKQFPVERVIAIGKPDEPTQLVDITIIEFPKFKSLVSRVKSLKHDIKNLMGDTCQALHIVLTSGNMEETLILSLLAQSLGVMSYYFVHGEIQEIYPFNVEVISPLSMQILNKLVETDEIESLSILKEKIEFPEPDYTRSIAKLGYIISKLEKSGYVRKKKDGRNLSVAITSKGLQYVALFG